MQRWLPVACVAISVVLGACSSGGGTDEVGDGPHPSDVAADSGNVWLERRVANIAHGGGLAEAPESTMYAFKTAEARGADVLETDLQISADGEVVLMHDSTVDDRTDGRGCVVEHTLAELQELDAAHTHEGPDGDHPFRGIVTGEREAPEGYAASDFTVPTLAELFETFPDTPMVIEIKPLEADERDGVVHDCPGALAAMDAAERPDLVVEVAALIEEHDMADQVLVASFDDALMEGFAAIAPEVDTGFALEEGLALFTAFTDGETDAPNPLGHVALEAPIDIALALDPAEAEAFVAWLHDHDIAVHFWTVNDEADMETLLDWDADGIITDRVVALESVLESRGEPRP